MEINYLSMQGFKSIHACESGPTSIVVNYHIFIHEGIAKYTSAEGRTNWKTVLVSSPRLESTNSVLNRQPGKPGCVHA